MYITDMLYIFLQRGINKGLSYLIYIEWLLHFAHMCVRNVEVTLCALMFVSTESTQTLISCKCWNVNGGCVHAFVCFCFASVCAHVRGRMCMCVCVCVCACLGLSNCPRAWQHSCNNYNNKTWCVCVCDSYTPNIFFSWRLAWGNGNQKELHQVPPPHPVWDQRRLTSSVSRSGCSWSIPALPSVM